MSEIVEALEKYLQSNLSCDEINGGMNKLSKYKLNKTISEEEIIFIFNKFCSDYFPEEVKEHNKKMKGRNFIMSNEEIFEMSTIIIKNKNKYENKCFYKSIELFYKTFFYIQIFEENEANDFTFYISLSEHLIDKNNYETYLFNIGNALLDQKDQNKHLIEILFSA